MKALSLKFANQFRKAAAKRGVSRVARSSRGFMAAYAKAGSIKKLSPWWRNRRNNFIKRHMAQVRKRHEPLFDRQGRPTRRHLALVMWAASPSPARLRKALR